MSIGPRIKLARAKAGLSLRELAELVGVSPTAISKFERGEATPRQSTLLKLAKALSVGIEYFFREIRVQTMAPAYRKHSRFGARSQEALEATVVETVERHLTAEELFPEDFFPAATLPRFAIASVQDAEQAADRLREKWSLGSDPIQDFCGRLEIQGVKVVPLGGPDGFDGFSCLVNGDIPVIAFNSSISGDRQRFSLCHELGHLVLEPASSVDVEKAAHRFAGAFLVPAQAARGELGRKRTKLSFDELLLLKKEYGVSVQVWIRRALDLGIIDPGTYSMLFRQLSARGWRTKEPNGIPSEQPRRLRLLIHQALAENLITPSFAAVLLDSNPKVWPDFSLGKSATPSPALEREYLENDELTAFLNADVEDFRDENL